ncbi:MAG TPA: prepilin-type N-terminal cleavage/methylation domain-containing protein [Roseimicrobium sp.]|nr:prepilin-type N-terminal cleavage/methylation domain-containing protein [Roseimicrobium sp.]
MTPARANDGLRAFTLVELLVVIAVIGILASLLLPVLSRGKEKARSISCRNSIKQLALAVTMYHGDFNDLFPTPGSSSKYGPQPEDWIWWQYGRDLTNSSIVRYFSGFDPKYFTCPADSVAKKLQDQGMIAGDPYRYSYALTSYDLQEGMNIGLSTIITQDREVFSFRASQVRNPSGKLMFVEEDRATIDDSRWVPAGVKTNLVSPRHSGKGAAAFVDGHVEIVSPEFGLNLTNSTPLQ